MGQMSGTGNDYFGYVGFNAYYNASDTLTHASSNGRGVFMIEHSAAAAGLSTATLRLLSPTLTDEGYITIANGNVGIGTTNPSTSKLEVWSASTGEVNLARFATSGDGGQGFDIGVDTTNKRLFFDSASTNTYDWQFGIAGAAQLLIDSSTGNVGIGTTTPNHLITLGNGQTQGAYSDGATWSNGSDRNSKENFTALDPQAVLAKIVQLPITQWNYKTQSPAITHIGPVAQDFYALFGLNGSDVAISTVDPAGVALLGIQALASQMASTTLAFASTTDALLASTTNIGMNVSELQSSVASLQLFASSTAATSTVIEMKVASLEERVTALEAAASSTAAACGGQTSCGGLTSASSDTVFNAQLLTALQALSAQVAGSMWHFVAMAADNLFAAHITADNIAAQNLAVGSSDAPAGITLFDAVTKQPFCFSIIDGIATSTPGACAQTATSSYPFAAGSVSGGQTSAGGLTSATTTSTVNPAAPVIAVNGNNPAQVQLGSTYVDLGAVITGPATALNLGISAIVNGGATTTPDQIYINTTVVGTSTIEYFAIDQNGLMGTASRTVVVFDPNPTVVIDTTATSTATSTPPAP